MTLDHVIVGGPTLEVLAAALVDATGVAAAPGGRHPGFGTHNALAGLGGGRYLELLAPDPTQDGGDFAALVAHLRTPALVTWCARAGSADEVEARVLATGLRPRRVAMQRRRADGALLAWELVFADAHPYGGLLPFFIDWGDTPHPSAALGSPLALTAFELTHPDADGLERLLTRLGGVADGVRVVGAATASIAAELRAAERRWRLSGDQETAA